jgi:hypothetical protein
MDVRYQFMSPPLQPLRRATGPADLLHVREGYRIVIIGEPAPDDWGHWSAAIGMAAMRGASVVKP